MNHTHLILCAFLSAFIAETHASLENWDPSHGDVRRADTFDTHEVIDPLIKLAKWTDVELSEALQKESVSLKETITPAEILIFLENAAIKNVIDLSRVEVLTALNGRIASKSPTLAIPIVHQIEDGSVRDPGYSYRVIDHTLQSYLEALHARAKVSQTRVKTLDLGAGHGWASTLSVVAGAPFIDKKSQNRGVHVTALENHGSLLGAKGNPGPLMYFLREAKEISSALSDTNMKNYGVVVSGDATKTLQKDLYNEAFDFAYVGNVLHYNAPLNNERIVALLFQTLTPGGKAYATAHTSLDFSDTEKHGGNDTLRDLSKTMTQKRFDVYQSQYQKGNNFPGWMVITKMLTYQKNAQLEDTIKSVTQIGAESLNESSDDLSPVLETMGKYKSNTTSEILRGDGTYTQISHRSYLIFDAISLRSLFERAGFTVDDVFYENFKGSRINIEEIGDGKGRFLSADETNRMTRVGIIASKPQSSSSSSSSSSKATTYAMKTH